VSAGGYHHHVGLNTWAGVGAAKPPPGSQGLEHFELVLPDEAAVDAAVERIDRAGAPVQQADHGSRAVDPSGNAVLVRAA
jgi:catechol 2,3-dioxygenase